MQALRLQANGQLMISVHMRGGIYVGSSKHIIMHLLYLHVCGNIWHANTRIMQKCMVCAREGEKGNQFLGFPDYHDSPYLHGQFIYHFAPCFIPYWW